MRKVTNVFISVESFNQIPAHNCCGASVFDYIKYMDGNKRRRSKSKFISTTMWCNDRMKRRRNESLYILNFSQKSTWM